MLVCKQFDANHTTHSAAQHLLAALELQDKRGSATVTDGARHLHIPPGRPSHHS